MGALPNPSKLGCFSMKSGWFLGIPPRDPHVKYLNSPSRLRGEKHKTFETEPPWGP